jgi:hypothetical protein
MRRIVPRTRWVTADRARSAAPPDVGPAAQAEGGRQLIDESVLTRADAAGEPAWLVAISPRNRALYERHGFACVRDLALPDGATAFAMWREPVGSRSSAGAT